mmetsp:Transcript_26695/g.49144  ORF Transcript_26695/g.49144 Transcript_26695/m.49144 type:complete len:195 (+) Transcript_26695:3-587(+)
MCLMSSKTRSKHMMIMPVKMVFWSSQLVVIFLHVCVLFTDVMPIHLEMVLFIYLCGFSITFTPQDGVRRWLGLACLQVLFIPFFLYMEFMGVLGGVREIVTRNAGTNFHIVKKENVHNVQLKPEKADESLNFPLLTAESSDEVTKVPSSASSASSSSSDAADAKRQVPLLLAYPHSLKVPLLTADAGGNLIADI